MSLEYSIVNFDHNSEVLGIPNSSPDISSTPFSKREAIVQRDCTAIIHKTEERNNHSSS